MLSITKVKRAEVTVEVVLSGLLAVVVLFLVLGLFSKNLKTMFSNTNMNNFYIENNSAKTANSFMKNDPTKTQINVAIVAEQGLEAYHIKARAKIEAFALLKDSLTAEQKTNLAEALTIYSVSGDYGTADSQYSTYKQLGLNNGINISFKTGACRTIVAGDSKSPYNWGINNNNANTNVNSEEKDRIANIIFIKHIFN